VRVFFIYKEKEKIMLLNYNDYIFEQKLDLIFSNINEDLKWISDNEVEWDIIEKKIPKTNSNFWDIINSLSKNSKKILGILLLKITQLTNNISKQQLNKLLNKALEKSYQIIKDTSIKKKIAYVILFFVITTTSLSFDDINIDNELIKTDITELQIKPIVNIDNSTTPDIIKSTIQLKSTKDYFKKLAFKESSNTWDTVRYVTKRNKRIPVYVGKYQFGNMAFKDIKSDVRVKDFVNDPSIWTSEQQDLDLIKLLNNNKHYLRKKNNFKGYKHYIGTTINGVDMTESGILTAAHLVGNRGVKRFLKSNGKVDPVDGNGTKCSHYMDEFKNYQLPI